jgi:hypothetical protein
MTDRRRRAANADPEPSHEDNPFAAPPEGRPDRPWRPRRPEGPSAGKTPSGGNGHGGNGDDRGPDGGNGDGGGEPHWGSRWSSQQPGRDDGGFGGAGRPDQGGNGGNGGGPGGRKTPGLRWDPTDPKQRHARYALHGGIWGLFFALFGMGEIGLLLGALSVYWGISALRGPSGVRSTPTATATAADVAGTDRGGRPDQPGGGGASGGARPAGMEMTVTPAQAAKARRAAAVSGLVAGILTLVGVAGDFTQRMVYEEYYTCRQDALTQSAREQCEDLPEGQVPWFVEATQEPRE